MCCQAGKMFTVSGELDVVRFRPSPLARVKFGVPLDQVCRNDIPGPLLVLILKLNKEAPYKKDIFRAPGHQRNMKKLIHFLQSGCLVNIDNFSVYTIASVLKKFLRKIPGGIFGPEREERLFQIINANNEEEQWGEIHQLILAMPVFAQRLLVLLFGTFRVIAVNAEHAQTGMSSEALGVSVAPSFFHTCVSDGKQAKMEDVMRFKIATRIMKYLIDNFGTSNLYGRENYEYYARITGRILKVDNEWIFAFRYPPETTASREEMLEAQQRWLEHEAGRWGLVFNMRALSTQEESHSTPALIHVPETLAELGEPGTSGLQSSSYVPENTLRESHTRLSVSLEESELFKGTSSSSTTTTSSSSTASTSTSSSTSSRHRHRHRINLEELRAINRYAESTKSLTYLPQVHARQTARMMTRSEWFLSAASDQPSGSGGPAAGSRLYVVPIEFEEEATYRGGHTKVLRSESGGSSGGGAGGNGGSHHHHRVRRNGGDHGKLTVRRTSSKDKKAALLLRRSSSKSKKDKENGNNKAVSVEVLHHEKTAGSSAGGVGSGTTAVGPGSPSRRGSAPGGALMAQALAASHHARTQQLHHHHHHHQVAPQFSRSVSEQECGGTGDPSDAPPTTTSAVCVTSSTSTLSYKPRI